MRFMFSLAAAAVAAILFLGCGSTEEALQNDPQALATSPVVATASPTPSSAPTPAANVVPAAIVTPTPTPIPVSETGVVVAPPSRDSLPPTPVDWLTMSDPALRGLTFSYPPNWFLASEGGKLLSFDPATTKHAHDIPAGGIILDFDWVPADGVGTAKPEGATDTSFAEAPGWELVRVFGPALRGHTVVVSGNNQFYVFSALFGDGDAEETVFLQILESAQIADWP